MSDFLSEAQMDAREGAVKGAGMNIHEQIHQENVLWTIGQLIREVSEGTITFDTYLAERDRLMAADSAVSSKYAGEGPR